jgi:rhodanese-related sulfurtransferase
MSVRTITPKELEGLRRQGRVAERIDVRTSVEYREVHAEPARLVSLDELDPGAVISARDGTTGEPLDTICRSGSRGRSAAERFQTAGFTNMVNVEGGMLTWKRAGLPLVLGKKIISLERQVRMAAGSLVVLGRAVRAFVHPGFLAVSGFDGAGLVLAGVTDTCGKAMILARMPWNRDGSGEAACAR